MLIGVTIADVIWESGVTMMMVSRLINNQEGVILAKALDGKG